MLQHLNGLGPKELKEIKRTKQEWSGELELRRKSQSRKKLIMSYLLVLTIIVSGILYIFVH